MGECWIVGVFYGCYIVGMELLVGLSLVITLVRKFRV